MTDIQPGQRFVLYNGSGTWGHFECEVLDVDDKFVWYTSRPIGGDDVHKYVTSRWGFQKLIDDGYVEMKQSDNPKA